MGRSTLLPAEQAFERIERLSQYFNIKIRYDHSTRRHILVLKRSGQLVGSYSDVTLIRVVTEAWLTNKHVFSG